MNNRQLTFMWIGIAILIAFCLFVMGEAGKGNNKILIIFQSIVIIIVSVTIGVVAQTGQTGNKPKDKQDNK